MIIPENGGWWTHRTTFPAEKNRGKIQKSGLRTHFLDADHFPAVNSVIYGINKSFHLDYDKFPRNLLPTDWSSNTLNCSIKVLIILVFSWRTSSMRRSAISLLFFLGCLCAASSHRYTLRAEDRVELNSQIKPQMVRDLLWVWNTHNMDQPGNHTLATYAQANAVQKMDLLNIPNVMMCGNGLPENDQEAFDLTKSVTSSKRLVWEILTDDGLHKPPFAYTKTAARIRRLFDEDPKIEAVLLDDMSSMSVKAGFKPKHITAIRDLLPDKYLDIKIWGVVYTMNMRQPGMDEIIKALDVINMWVWSAKDVVDLEEHVAYIEALTPEKPIVLGLYLHDYGGGRNIPQNLLEAQCQTALKLAHAGRIEGIVFLTIDNNPEVLQWTADWIEKVGNQKIGISP